MSKGLRFDALLARALAGELRAALARAEAKAAWLDGERRLAALYTAGDRVLRFDLHPGHGFMTLGRGRPPRVAAPLPPRALREVLAAPDERRLHVRFGDGDGGFEWIVDWTTNRWNAWLVGADGIVQRVLHAPKSEGGRAATPLPGEPWATAPPPPERAGRDGRLSADEWAALLSSFPPAPPASFERAVLRAVAYTSPLNLPFLLAPVRGPEDRDGIAHAYLLWRELLDAPAAPHLLVRPWGLQPYPHPLAEPDARPVPSLLDGMLELRRAAVRPVEVERAQTELERRQAAVERRLERLREQLRRADEAARLQHLGDVLLTRLNEVPPGASRAELEDFGGGRVEIELDPSLTPAANANRLYAEAKRLRRAARQIPRLVEEATSEMRRLTAWLEHVEKGDVPDEVRRVIRKTDRACAEPEAPALPYRLYRTSSGLEVRVGKSARDNDELTLRHTSPHDVWMHARGVPGSHVVLRWPRRDQNPPERDLVEAATLAAWFSKARGSKAVPIDWTRRRYVRKPRKTKPGLVTLERAQTVFVEPSEEVERRLRADENALT